MSMSSRSVLAGVSLSLCLALPTAALADRTIDPFTDPLPGQTLPYTSSPAPDLWAGTIGELAQPLQIARQASLASVAGGARVVQVGEATLSNFITATLTGGRLSYSTGLAPSGSLTLEYGATADLNLNVSADHAFSLYLEGDLSSGASPRPVQLTISVRTSGIGTFKKTYTLLNNGSYRFPFTDFPYVSWSDVDYVKLQFDASAVRGIDFDLVGGLKTVY